MYWLKWHYHVKDIAGAPYKIKQNRQKRRQSVAEGRHYTVEYSHDRLIINRQTNRG